MNYTVLLQPALLIVSTVTVLFYVVRAMKHKSAAPLKAALTVAAVAFTFTAALVVTPPGHRGVIYSQSGGVQTAERVEGLSFVIPYIQSAVQMDVRTQKWGTVCPSPASCVDAAFAQSSDLQEITVHIAVGHHLDPTLAAELYRDVGRGYEAILIRPLAFQFVKAEVGQIKAVDFAQKRDEIAGNIHDALATELAPYGVVVEWVSIEDAIFDEDFIRAIKEKVIADEEADEQRRLVEAERHKKAQVILQAEAAAADIRLRADAQAEANTVVAESLTSDLLIWQRVTGWNGELPETFIGNNDPLDLLFTVGP